MAMTAFLLKTMSTAVNGGGLFVGRLGVASPGRPLSPLLRTHADDCKRRPF
jgi:hypothetical protein